MDEPNALALRLSGLTYGEVGKTLGVSRQRVQQLLAPPAAIRRIVVTRAKGLCEKCGITAERGGHVHHKASVGLVCDQYHDLDNLALLCPGCHRLVHQPTVAQRMRRLARSSVEQQASNPDDMSALKRQLRRLHITHDQIAARAKVSRTYVCHYLARRRTAAKVKHAIADLVAARLMAERLRREEAP